MLIQGFASTSDIDKAGDQVMVSAFFDAMDAIGADPAANVLPILVEHDPQRVAGKVTALSLRHGKLWVEADLFDGISPHADAIIKTIRRAGRCGLSIGGRTVRRIGPVILEFDLREISLVARPCNEAAQLVGAPSEWTAGFEDEIAARHRANATRPRPEMRVQHLIRYAD